MGRQGGGRTARNGDVCLHASRGCHDPGTGEAKAIKQVEGRTTRASPARNRGAGFKSTRAVGLLVMEVRLNSTPTQPTLTHGKCCYGNSTLGELNLTLLIIQSKCCIDTVKKTVGKN